MPVTTHPPTKEAICRCAACGESFSGLSVFDRHRKGGMCLPPETIGLEMTIRPKGTLWANAEVSASSVL